jgi:hypothetical protein
LRPGFWDQLDEKIDRGDIIAPMEVKIELKSPEDLVAWVKQRPNIFRELDQEFQTSASEVIGRIQEDAKAKQLILKPNQLQADPFVVALARINGTVVVTEEKPGRSPAQGRPKIPDLCDWYDVEYVDLFGFMRAEGIVLRS